MVSCGAAVQGTVAMASATERSSPIVASGSPATVMAPCRSRSTSTWWPVVLVPIGHSSGTGSTVPPARSVRVSKDSVVTHRSGVALVNPGGAG